MYDIPKINVSFDLSGKVALVTGVAEGIGEEIAKIFCQFGADVAVLDIQDEKLAVRVKEMNEEYPERTVRNYHCDVRCPEEVEKTVAKVIEDFGKINILVNNAGILNYNPIETYTVEQWHDAIDTDLTGPWFVTKEVVRQYMMQKNADGVCNGGSVINISSIAGFLGTDQGCLSYHAAKGGVLGLTKGQAVDYARYGVRVNSVGPGTTLSGGMTFRSKVASNPETHAKGRVPMKRAGYFGEMAGAVVYFASDASSFTTGQNLFCDGGISSTLN